MPFNIIHSCVFQSFQSIKILKLVISGDACLQFSSLVLSAIYSSENQVCLSIGLIKVVCRILSGLLIRFTSTSTSLLLQDRYLEMLFPGDITHLQNITIYLLGINILNYVGLRSSLTLCLKLFNQYCSCTSTSIYAVQFSVFSFIWRLFIKLGCKKCVSIVEIGIWAVGHEIISLEPLLSHWTRNLRNRPKLSSFLGNLTITSIVV